VRVLYGDPSGVARQVFPSINTLGEILLMCIHSRSTPNRPDANFGYYFCCKSYENGEWSTEYEDTPFVPLGRSIDVRQGIGFNVQAETDTFGSIVSTINGSTKFGQLVIAYPVLAVSNPAFGVANNGEKVEYVIFGGGEQYSEWVWYSDWRLTDVLAKSSKPYQDNPDYDMWTPEEGSHNGLYFFGSITCISYKVESIDI
jgi:hypothetical protein